MKFHNCYNVNMDEGHFLHFFAHLFFTYVSRYVVWNIPSLVCYVDDDGFTYDAVPSSATHSQEDVRISVW